MSSTHTPEPSTERITRSTARNPRRRARQSDNDTLKSQAPRRKRSKITEETYAPRDSIDNESVAPSVVSVEIEEEQKVPAMNGHTPTSHYTNGFTQHERKASSTPAVDFDVMVAVRGGKKGTVKRSHLRGDGATTLCSNQCYSVKMLPSTPKDLKKEGLEYRGSIGANNYALATTRNKALVWEYAAHGPAANTRTFDMPFPSRTGEPVPFGALVPSALSTSDLGLILISATTGRAIFYESIDRAASLGLFQDRRSGVEGSIPLSSGETVTAIVSAEFAGFILILSSGKIVHLTLRDAQGKASISVQQLKIVEVGSEGVFGSFTGLLKANYRRDLTAVHTRALRERGNMQVVGLTEKSGILLWDIDWRGHSEFRASIDFREVLVKELKSITSPELAGNAEQIVALDFAITDRPGVGTGRELTRTAGDSADQPLYLYILLRIVNPGVHKYALVEMSLPGDGGVAIDRIHKIKTYQTDGRTSTLRKPRLSVPRPGHTAFVTFEDAIVVAALSETISDSPEAQLHTSYVQPETFEDAIYLRPANGLAMLGTCEEAPRTTHASIISFVKGGGLVRTSAIDVNTILGGPKISAKSQIEQAVFYGTLQQDNIVDFSRKDYSSGRDLGEVEDAALAVSDEILRAETKFTQFISPTAVNIRQHLAVKAQALKALTNHVVTTYPGIPKSTTWRLLWDAERVAAGQKLWTTFEEHVALVSVEKRKATLLDEVCAWFKDKEQQFTLRKDLANEDSVRQFFIGGLHNLELLLDNVRILLRDYRNDTSLAPDAALKLVAQANGVWLAALETAFQFRSENCAEYGILPELIDDGILIEPTEYTDLAEFWTSDMRLLRNTVAVANLSHEIASKRFETMAPGDEGEELAREAAANNHLLLGIWCVQYQEAIRWRLGQHEPKHQEMAEKMERDFEDERYANLRKQADLGQSDAGMKLAEKYRDMRTLTDMVVAEDQYLEDAMQEEVDKTAVIQMRNDLRVRVKKYFERYGELWSNAFFDNLFSGSSSGAKLMRAQIEWEKPLTQYLRAHPSRAKLCWINDVSGAHDYAHAAEALAQCAEKQEIKVWAKKVELSMSKLALLAAEEASPSAGTKLTNGAYSPTRLQSELEVVDVQNHLYKHLQPDILASIDKEAELIVCMQTYSKPVEQLPALRQLLENGLNMVLNHDALSFEQLLDVLTLMQIKYADDSDFNFNGTEFFKALSVLAAVGPSISDALYNTLLQLIWKRCYIYDNWSVKNVLKKKADAERTASTRDSAAWQTILHVLRAGMPDLIVKPSETIGGGCQAADFAHRFPSEDLLDPILHDCQIQDQLLKGYVETQQLDDIIDQAVRDAKAFIEEQAEEAAALAKQERHVQESFVENEEKNGNVEKFEVDGDGDLEME